MEELHSEIESSASALPRHIVEEIVEFEGRVRAYLDGSLSPDDFKKCRLQLGIYGLRGIKDKQMVRVKIPSGRITAEQLERLADLAEGFATGRGHVTTRQDIQMYEVSVERTPQLLRELAAVGLTTREACGNTVRNVTACPFAGLCADELFDVAPYSIGVSRYLLRNPFCQYLPRKFKISFSGCAHDCAMAPIHDIGAVAARHSDDGRLRYGFKLYVGGGLGPFPMAAQPLEPFTCVEHLLPTCEAIICVFDKHGERKNRQKARMKFLVERIGFEQFRELVFQMREELLKQLDRFPKLPAPEPFLTAPLDHPVFPDQGIALYRRWLATNVRGQRQRGFAVVTARLLLGDLTAHQMRGFSRLARRCSRSQLITTQWQDICLAWVEPRSLQGLYEDLKALDLALSEAQRIQDITACPGADTCQIGITSSRGLARALTELLEKPEYQTDDLKDLRIKISGCPNSCGQHHIADIGLFGATRSVGGKLAPHYHLLVGGGFDDLPAAPSTGSSMCAAPAYPDAVASAGRQAGGHVHFGQPVAKIPAKRVPQALERLLEFYRRERYNEELFHNFIQRVGIPALGHLLKEFTVIGDHLEEPDAYQDWGRNVEFSLGGIGQGECAG